MSHFRFGAFVFLAPSLALANVGIPVLALSFTLSVMFLIPVVLIETLVVRRIVPLSFLRSLGLVAVANILSTLAGVILVFGLAYFPSIMVTRGMVAEVLTLLSLIPLCFFSAWVELRYALWRVKDHPVDKIQLGIERANSASYCFLAAIVLARIAGHMADVPCASPLLQGCYASVADALRERQFDAAKKIVRSGGELGQVGRAGESLLHSAGRYGDAELVRLLVDRGLDVHARNSNGETPLLVADDSGSPEGRKKMEILLARGADVSAKDSQGNTALQRSAYGGHADRVALLLAHGADVNVADSRGNTPLHSQSGRNSEVTKLLLAKRADVTAVDADGDTPLHKAAYISDNLGSVKLLLEAGSEINARNKHGQTPLDLASRAELSEEVRHRFAEVVKLLIAHGGRKTENLPAQ